MSIEIICAMIGGSAVIIAAIIAAISTKRKRSSKKDKSAPSLAVNDINGNNVIVGNENVVNYNLPFKVDALVQIVDTAFIADKSGYYIDIKLSNKGDSIAFAKQITFSIHEVFPLKNPQITSYSFMPSTATYNVTLNSDSKQTFKLSQSIKANDVDRFKIKVASAIAEARMVTVYAFTYTIEYDEDKQTASSPQFIAVFPSIIKWAGCCVTDFSKDIAKQNYYELIRISNIDGIKSDTFLSLLKSYEDRKSDFL